MPHVRSCDSSQRIKSHNVRACHTRSSLLRGREVPQEKCDKKERPCNSTHDMMHLNFNNPRAVQFVEGSKPHTETASLHSSSSSTSSSSHLPAKPHNRHDKQAAQHGQQHMSGAVFSWVGGSLLSTCACCPQGICPSHSPCFTSLSHCFPPPSLPPCWRLCVQTSTTHTLT